MTEKIDRRKRKIGLWTDPEGLKEIDNSVFHFKFEIDEHQHNSWYDPTVYEGEAQTSDVFPKRVRTAAAVEADKKRYKRWNFYDNDTHSYYEYSKCSGDGSPTTESAYGGFKLEYGISLDEEFANTYLFDKPENVDYERSSRLCEVCQKGVKIAKKHGSCSGNSKIILLKNKGTCTSKEIFFPHDHNQARRLDVGDKSSGRQQIMALNNPELAGLIQQRVGQSNSTKSSYDNVLPDVSEPIFAQGDPIKHGHCVLNFKVRPQKRVVITDDWINRCKHVSSVTEPLPEEKKEKYKILDEIISAPKRCEENLRKIVELEECSNILRIAAIDRLTEITPKPKTAILLEKLFKNVEQNEDVRIRAYMSHIHIRYNFLNKPFSEEEKEDIKNRMNTEPSERMRWYMSMKI